MKIEKMQKLHKAIAKDGRLAVVHVCRVDAGHVAVATDGRKMAVVPVTLDDGDEPGAIPGDAWKAATGTKATGVIGINGSVSVATGGGAVATFERPDEAVMDWREVCPKPSNEGSVLNINVSLLAELAAALGSEVLTLRIPAPIEERGSTIVRHAVLVLPHSAGVGDMEGAGSFVADGSEAFGVIMPLTR